MTLGRVYDRSLITLRRMGRDMKIASLAYLPGPEISDRLKPVPAIASMCRPTSPIKRSMPAETRRSSASLCDGARNPWSSISTSFPLRCPTRRSGSIHFASKLASSNTLTLLDF